VLGDRAFLLFADRVSVSASLKKPAYLQVFLCIGLPEPGWMHIAHRTSHIVHCSFLIDQGVEPRPDVRGWRFYQAPPSSHTAHPWFQMADTQPSIGLYVAENGLILQ
jgi:hypothetical protein